MSSFLTVFLKKDAPLPLSQVASFLREGVYFEDESLPTFDQPDAETSSALNWKSLAVRYSPENAPIIIEYHQDMGRVEALTSEVLDDGIIGLPPSQARETVSDHLRRTRRIVMIEVRPVGVDGRGLGDGRLPGSLAMPRRGRDGP